MFQMAMLLFRGMLTIGHRKASQLGEVRVSFLWDSTASQGRSVDRETERQTERQKDQKTEHRCVIGSKAKAKGTAASSHCSPALPLP